MTAAATAWLGLGGAKRNACAAVCLDGGVMAVCEQERLTRVRGIGLGPCSLPAEAVDQVLALANCGADGVSGYVVAEPQVRLPATLPTVTVDHHRAHAATAFFTSPFARAAVIVCDSAPGRDVSVWHGHGAHLVDLEWPWRGRGFANLYADGAAVFGLGPRRAEHHLETLAHVGHPRHVERLRSLIRYRADGLSADPHWSSTLSDMIRDERQRHGREAVDMAASFQQRIAEVLLEFAADVRDAVGGDVLCLGGGLFYNTALTTCLRQSGLFERVFTPINPGNAGLAIGAALAVEGQPVPTARQPVSPFLGPEFDAETIKRTLDGCKLSYAFVSDDDALNTAVDALSRGLLVGWFDGRMEWGPRALGHRSILANPASPYVLDNLNSFLRKRERWRPFGVSVRADTASDLFDGPDASPFMEFEYGVRDDRLRHVIPAGAASIRVQTVTPEVGRFWELHRRMEQATGLGVLVNTSLNGFREPIACTPADAVRVFYGTGLDVLVIGRFILRK